MKKAKNPIHGIFLIGKKKIKRNRIPIKFTLKIASSLAFMAALEALEEHYMKKEGK